MFAARLNIPETQNIGHSSSLKPLAADLVSRKLNLIDINKTTSTINDHDIITTVVTAVEKTTT